VVGEETPEVGGDEIWFVIEMVDEIPDDRGDGHCPEEEPVQADPER
jgi:hypothetical protein